MGDTVNLASRMESHGLPDHIQVSEAVYERIHDRFALEPRGVVEVKGRGPMQTYWLLDRRDDAGGLPPVPAVAMARSR